MCELVWALLGRFVKKKKDTGGFGENIPLFILLLLFHFQGTACWVTEAYLALARTGRPRRGVAPASLVLCVCMSMWRRAPCEAEGHLTSTTLLKGPAQVM